MIKQFVEKKIKIKNIACDAHASHALLMEQYGRQVQQIYRGPEHV